MRPHFLSSKPLKPSTQEGSDYIDLFVPFIDSIIESEYNGMSAEGQENIDKLAQMMEVSPGCFLLNKNNIEIWDAKYDEPKGLLQSRLKDKKSFVWA